MTEENTAQRPRLRIGPIAETLAYDEDLGRASFEMLDKRIADLQTQSGTAAPETSDLAASIDKLIHKSAVLSKLIMSQQDMLILLASNKGEETQRALHRLEAATATMLTREGGKTPASHKALSNLMTAMQQRELTDQRTVTENKMPEASAKEQDAPTPNRPGPELSR